MGWLRFKGEPKDEGIGLTRLGLGIGVFTFVLYMIPGLFGAPLKALSGYLPPMKYQERSYTRTNDLEIPHGLPGCFSLSEALERWPLKESWFLSILRAMVAPTAGRWKPACGAPRRYRTS